MKNFNWTKLLVLSLLLWSAYDFALAFRFYRNDWPDNAFNALYVLVHLTAAALTFFRWRK